MSPYNQTIVEENVIKEEFKVFSLVQTLVTQEVFCKCFLSTVLSFREALGNLILDEKFL